MGYVDYPVQVDPDLIVADAVAQLRAATGAQLNQGHPIAALFELIAYRIAETRIVMADVGASIFRDFGLKIMQVPQIGAFPASALAEFTVENTNGHTIPEGTRISYPVTGTERIAFATEDELVIPPGQTTGTTEVVALVHGTAANGLPAATVSLMEQLGYITAVATTETTSGGVDAETATEYLDRIAEEIRSPGVLVLPPDYETAARRVPGVHRALAIPGYEPTGPSSGNERTVTVAVVDQDGAAVGTDVKALVTAELQERREVNFIVHVVDPDFNAITVVFTATAAPGADSIVVEAAAEAAVAAYLDPSAYGGGGESPPAWRDEVIRYFEIAHIIEGVDGIADLETLTINGGTANVTMTGVAPLPTPTVTGTVT